MTGPPSADDAPGDTLGAAAQWLRARYPELARGLLAWEDTGADPRDRELAAEVFSAFHRKVAGEPGGVRRGLEGVAHFSFEFLRLQARFMRTGRYARLSARDLRHDLYERDDVMNGYYLDGLLLTYSFWPNHLRLLRFFVDDFLPLLPAGARTVEVGVGHGLMPLFLLRTLPEARYCGLDLSAHSLAYARALLEASGIDGARADFLERDIVVRGAPGERASWDAAVGCEVLEHVDEPRRLLDGLHEALRSGGLAFVTTVANLEAEDHVYLFEDEGHIRRTLEEAGFAVRAERVLPLRGFEDARPRPLNYAAIMAAR